MLLSPTRRGFDSTRCLRNTTRGSRRRSVREETLYRFHSRSPSLALALARSRDRSSGSVSGATDSPARFGRDSSPSIGIARRARGRAAMSSVQLESPSRLRRPSPRNSFPHEFSLSPDRRLNLPFLSASRNAGRRSPYGVRPYVDGIFGKPTRVALHYCLREQDHHVKWPSCAPPSHLPTEWRSM